MSKRVHVQFRHRCSHFWILGRQPDGHTDWQTRAKLNAWGGMQFNSLQLFLPWHQSYKTVRWIVIIVIQFSLAYFSNIGIEDKKPHSFSQVFFQFLWRILLMLKLERQYSESVYIPVIMLLTLVSTCLHPLLLS